MALYSTGDKCKDRKPRIKKPLGNFGTKTPNLTFYIKNGIIIIRKNIKKDRFDTMELNIKQEGGRNY